MEQDLEYGIIDLYENTIPAFHVFSDNLESGKGPVIPLPQLIVFPDDKACNKEPLLVTSDRIDLDYLVGVDNNLRYVLKDKVYATPDLLNDLDDEPMARNAMSAASIPMKCTDKAACLKRDVSVSLLKTWSHKFLQSLRCNPLFEGRQIPEQIIVPVPDSLSVDAQDLLLESFSSISRPLLLWRSIAACIGSEQLLISHGVKPGDSVAVVDDNGSNVTISLITFYNHEGHLIPGHRIFRDSDDNCINSEFYEVLSSKKNRSTLNNLMPFDVLPSGKINRKHPKKGTSLFLQEKSFLNAKFVLFTKKEMNLLDSAYSSVTVIQSYDCIPRGAAIFAQMNHCKQVAYFDECEALSLVTITSDEMIQYKTLINKNLKAPGGTIITGETINGISLPKAQTKVKFFLRLGEALNDKPLKVLNQQFSLTSELIENPKDIPLCLYPTLRPGQGRAKVLIKVEKAVDRQYLNELSLDWTSMDDAYIEDNPKKGRETVDSLIKNMKRSFPVDTPSPEHDPGKFYKKKWEIEAFVVGRYSNAPFSLNDSSFPYKDESGLRKFTRTNVFGMPNPTGFNKDGLPSRAEYKELSIRFFKRLREEYINHDYDEKYLTPIGWTYHGEYYTDILNNILKDLEAQAAVGKGRSNRYFTIIPNLVTDNKQLARFLRAFFVRLDYNFERLSFWVRGAYLVVMIHTEFLSEEILTLSMFHNAVTNLLKYYRYTWNDNVLKLLVFLFKVRRKYPDYCRENSSNKESVECYNAVKDFCIFLGERSQYGPVIRKYLDGQGNMDLPIELFASDDES